MTILKIGYDEVTMLIRYAKINDIPAIQHLAHQHSKMLGFVRYASLERAVDKHELFVAIADGCVVGFVNWHARRDDWSTVYEIAVYEGYQGLGIGRMLLYSVPCPIRLKCTVDNPANQFYVNAGMSLARTEQGRKQALNVYEMRILTVTVRGGSKDVPEIARRSAQAYGVQSDDKPYAWPFMVDINWESYDWPEYLGKIKAWHPVMAMAADYEQPDQRDLMLTQVTDLRAAGIPRIMVCPKFDGALADIPADCIVAISLRTRGRLARGKHNKYAGFIPRDSLVGRRVHLLGGSPALQKRTIVQLQAQGARVVSVDGNAHIGAAELGSVYIDGKWRRKIGESVALLDMQVISSRNIQRELNAAAAWAQPKLF